MTQPNLTGTTFSWDTPLHAPSSILSFEGLEKSGRTHLACQGPEPIAYQGLDTGEDTMQKLRASGKKIAAAVYHYAHDPKTKNTEAQAEEIKKKVWDKFYTDYHAALTWARTVVWDTATEVWELLRLANFGKLSQVPEIAYPAVNSEFKEMVRAAQKANVNLMLIHQVKEERETKVVMTAKGPAERSVPTGRLTRAGMNKIGYLVDAYLLTRYVDPKFTGKGKDRKQTEPGHFEVEVLRARHAHEMVGQVVEFSGEQGSPDLLTLLSVIRPDVAVAEWGLGTLPEVVEVDLD